MGRIKQRYARLKILDRLFLAGYGVALCAGIAACVSAGLRVPGLRVPAGMVLLLLSASLTTLWTLSRFAFRAAVAVLVIGLAVSGGLLGGMGLLIGFLRIAGIPFEQLRFGPAVLFFGLDAACLVVFLLRRDCFGDPAPEKEEEPSPEWELPEDF